MFRKGVTMQANVNGLVFMRCRRLWLVSSKVYINAGQSLEGESWENTHKLMSVESSGGFDNLVVKGRSN